MHSYIRFVKHNKKKKTLHIYFLYSHILFLHIFFASDSNINALYVRTSFNSSFFLKLSFFSLFFKDKLAFFNESSSIVLCIIAFEFESLITISLVLKNFCHICVNKKKNFTQKEKNYYTPSTGYLWDSVFPAYFL